MTGLKPFLAAAKKRIERRLALVWAVRGAAAAAIAVLVIGLWSRRWALDPEWLFLLAGALAGAVLAVAGWLRARPTMGQVARISDRVLGAQERLSTALELSEIEPSEVEGSTGPMVPRQQSDAEHWIRREDPNRVVVDGPPRREWGVAIAAAVLATTVSFMPNPALARDRADQAAEDVREATADEVDRIADQVEGGGGPQEDGARREALVRELRLAADEVRDAQDPENAVAALSRAQDTLHDLGAPTAAGRRSAATGAAGALGQSAISAAAGQALAAVGHGAGDELSQMADLLPGLDSEASRALANELAAAAATSTDPALAARLKEAADNLQAGRTAEASAALQAAADAQQRSDATRAAAELRALADQAAGLTAAQRAELAESLARAAAAATDDPELAEKMSQAAKALGEQRPEDASEALREAGDRTEELADEEALDEEAAEAEAKLQAEKEDFAPEGCNTAAFGAGVPGEVVTVPPTVPGAPLVCRGQTSKEQEGKAGPGEQRRQQGSGRQGEGGSGGQGEGTGKGEGGQGDQSGQGGQGAGPEGGGNGPGGGAFGATGNLDQPPGAPSEEVYIPGISGPGRTQSAQGDQTGPGTDAALVPYESVYSEYRDAAVSQADRQALPQRMRQLLLRYFQDKP